MQVQGGNNNCRTKSCIISKVSFYHQMKQMEAVAASCFSFNLRFQPTRRLPAPRQELRSHVSGTRSSTAPDSGGGNRGRCVSRRRRSFPPFIIQLRLWTCQHSGGGGDDFIKRQKTFKPSPSPPPGAAFGLLITLTPHFKCPVFQQ